MGFAEFGMDKPYEREADLVRALDRYQWQPMETAPRDQSEILLLTTAGIVSAWYEKPSKVETMDGTEYEGDQWICYDDAFQIENDGGGILGWMPIPDHLTRDTNTAESG